MEECTGPEDIKVTKSIALNFLYQLFIAKNAHSAYGVLLGVRPLLNGLINSAEFTDHYAPYNQYPLIEGRREIASLLREMADALENKPKVG